LVNKKEIRKNPVFKIFSLSNKIPNKIQKKNSAPAFQRFLRKAWFLQEGSRTKSD
jgi:hypothetical protein